MSESLRLQGAIITGASQGLGLEIAREYVRQGAHVLLCARQLGPLERAYDELNAVARPDQKVLRRAADVADTNDARELAATAIAEFGQVHALVNNAGVYGPKGPIDEIDWDAWVEAIQINLLGSIQMCRALLPHFKAKRYGRIVQLSGGGATNPLPNLSAYATSKAGIIRFAETLAEETRSFGITVNAIAPGALNTRLLDEILEAGPQRVGQAFYEKSLKQKAEGGASMTKAAELAVFLGSEAAAGITGKLISAVWDPWKELPQYLHDLQKTDVYTLRRIGPGDRNLSWCPA
jgi:NAD(P)-dependent dehydrogenase (short-subunit alcohol dehydrogenase family)